VILSRAISILDVRPNRRERWALL